MALGTLAYIRACVSLKFIQNTQNLEFLRLKVQITGHQIVIAMYPSVLPFCKESMYLHFPSLRISIRPWVTTGGKREIQLRGGVTLRLNTYGESRKG